MEAYTCWSDDPKSTWEVEAFDADTAAEKYAEHKYEQDWDSSAVDGIDVFVKDSHTTRKFGIQVQMRPTFYAGEDYDWEPEEIGTASVEP